VFAKSRPPQYTPSPWPLVAVGQAAERAGERVSGTISGFHFKARTKSDRCGLTVWAQRRDRREDAGRLARGDRHARAARRDRHAPDRPGPPFIRPYGQEWLASEHILTCPLAGRNATMIARAGGLDQGNIILNLIDAERRGFSPSFPRSAWERTPRRFAASARQDAERPGSLVPTQSVGTRELG
jgi:hypothetical protein